MKKEFVEIIFCKGFTTFNNIGIVLFSILAFGFNFFFFMRFWHISKKSKNKDAWGLVVQKQYVFKGYCDVMYLRTLA